MRLYTLVIGFAPLQTSRRNHRSYRVAKVGHTHQGITPIYIKKYPIIIRSEEIRGWGTRKKGKKLVSWLSIFNVSASSFKWYFKTITKISKENHAWRVVKIVNHASRCYAQSRLTRLIWARSRITLIIWAPSRITENPFATLLWT